MIVEYHYSEEDADMVMEFIDELIPIAMKHARRFEDRFENEMMRQYGARQIIANALCVQGMMLFMQMKYEAEGVEGLSNALPFSMIAASVVGQAMEQIRAAVAS